MNNIAEIETPVGNLRLAAYDEAVWALSFTDHWDRTFERLEERLPVGARQTDAEPHARCIEKYVAGDLNALDDVTVSLAGTAFQNAVWNELSRIPVGETRSYAEVAAAIGRPAAVRAVGAANGANLIWIAVPCHRVIRSGGDLGGYGGGLDRKEWLLQHEGAWSRG